MVKLQRVLLVDIERQDAERQEAGRACAGRQVDGHHLTVRPRLVRHKHDRIAFPGVAALHGQDRCCRLAVTLSACMGREKVMRSGAPADTWLAPASGWT